MEGTQLDEAKLYEQLCANIRATDEISFKLLGLVPLVSGTALITVILGDASLDASLVVVLALFAAAVTLGLFRWELRNLQTCRWLIRCAEHIEETALSRQGSPNSLPLQPKAPQGLSKRHAEKWIYAVTIATWLGLPRFMLDDLQEWSLPHAVVGSLLGVLTLWSLLADVEVPAEKDQSRTDQRSEVYDAEKSKDAQVVSSPGASSLRWARARLGTYGTLRLEVVTPLVKSGGVV